MRFIDEFRDPVLARSLVGKIASLVSRPWTIMEVCGGQTHAIVRFGLDALLPDEITLVHGPGCPVCVTPASAIDAAVELGERGVIIVSFGDMLRVPGNRGDLFRARANGADVHVVYSPLDALTIAEKHPDREVVFFAVGFETTAPGNAMAVVEARRRGLENFSLLASHVLVPPAIRTIMDAPESAVDAFLAAGHVCSVMGTHEYQALSDDYAVPIAVTGFEPIDILRGVLACVEMLEAGRADCVNVYERAVSARGNAAARAVVDDVFAVEAWRWRGIGEIAESGLVFRDTWKSFDAWRRFGLVDVQEVDSGCRAGEVLMGAIKPEACPHFGSTCTPDSPLGAPMVSSEGACAAYWRYRRLA